jgi:hypothetical protein
MPLSIFPRSAQAKGVLSVDELMAVDMSARRKMLFNGKHIESR